MTKLSFYYQKIIRIEGINDKMKKMPTRIFEMTKENNKNIYEMKKRNQQKQQPSFLHVMFSSFLMQSTPITFAIFFPISFPLPFYPDIFHLFILIIFRFHQNGEKRRKDNFVCFSLVQNDSSVSSKYKKCNNLVLRSTRNPPEETNGQQLRS